MEKGLSQQLLRICSFSIPSTCQCDSLFPANPTGHKWPILNFQYLITMSSLLIHNFPTTHKCPRYAAFACQARDYARLFALVPLPGYPQSIGQENVNLPVLQVEQAAFLCLGPHSSISVVNERTTKVPPITKQGDRWNERLKAPIPRRYN